MVKVIYYKIAFFRDISDKLRDLNQKIVAKPQIVINIPVYCPAMN